ncbi:MAG: FAD-dependent monooxygenase [Pseudonocardiaceae bacterium]
MPVANAEVAVLIVGGGPVGLTTRALLERWGVRALLVEKHRELSPFPRSRLGQRALDGDLSPARARCQDHGPRVRTAVWPHPLP